MYRTHTELSELPIGEDKSAKRSQSLKSLVAVLPSGILVDGCARGLSIAAGDLLCLPDEVLQKIALVLGQDEVLGLLNDVAQIGDQVSTLGGELGRR